MLVLDRRPLPALLRLPAFDLAFGMMLVCCCQVRMTGQPPNKMSQSPERGHRSSLRSDCATNGRLAGAAAMLTHGVGGSLLFEPLHHWRFGLRSRHAHGEFAAVPRAMHACYSRAVKGHACSPANPAGSLSDFGYLQ